MTIAPAYKGVCMALKRNGLVRRNPGEEKKKAVKVFQPDRNHIKHATEEFLAERNITFIPYVLGEPDNIGMLFRNSYEDSIMKKVDKMTHVAVRFGIRKEIIRRTIIRRRKGD